MPLNSLLPRARPAAAATTVLFQWLWQTGAGGKSEKCARREFKLTRRHKLLSARGAGEEKNISP